MGLETIAIAATVVGAGVAAYGSIQSAAATERAAAYNAQIQRNNAILASRQAQAQAAQQVAIAENQAAWLQYNQQISLNNADALRKQAAVEQAVAAENARRQREQDRRELARMRARFAAAGVVISEGSPLKLEVESAELLELRVLEIGRQAEMRVQQLNQARTLELADASRYGTEISLSGVRRENALYNLRTAPYIAEVGEAQSRLTLMEGQARATGMRYDAYGSLLGAGGSAAYDWYRLRPATATG